MDNTHKDFFLMSIITSVKKCPGQDKAYCRKTHGRMRKKSFVLYKAKNKMIEKHFSTSSF